MLEVPPEWNEVPDLMMEGEDVWPATEAFTHSVTENTESRGILF